MSKSLIHAFFLGRATADALYGQVEHTLTDLLSDLGKFDAEQRERLRQFTNQVLEQAQQQQEAAMQGRSATRTTGAGTSAVDLQATIDELRAEIALVRSELQKYRSHSL